MRVKQDEEVTCMILNGDPDTAMLILRELLNATVCFEPLAEDVHKPSKSHHRLLSASGKPTMVNLSKILLAIKQALNPEIRTVITEIRFNLHQNSSRYTAWHVQNLRLT